MMKVHKKKRWTEEDVNTLLDQWGKNTPIKKISELLERPQTTVRTKVSNLRRNTKLKKLLKYRTVFKNYKLTAEDIPHIRKDNRSLRLIGLDYDVSAVTVYKIKNKETWKDA